MSKSKYSSIISKPKPSKEWPVQVVQAPGSLDCSLEKRPAVPQLQGLHSARFPHLETVLRSDLLGDASVWQPASWRVADANQRKQFNHPFIKLSYRNHTRLDAKIRHEVHKLDSGTTTCLPCEATFWQCPPFCGRAPGSSVLQRQNYRGSKYYKRFCQAIDTSGTQRWFMVFFQCLV